MTAEVAGERISRWWLDRPPIRTIEQAEDYLRSVQFSQLFGRDGRYPSLREVSRDDECERTPDGWGTDLEAMWGWKDDLPLRGTGWYGNLLGGKPTLVAPALLADLYDHPGDSDDFETLPGLSPAARSVARFLLLEGPTATRQLRQQTCGGSAKALSLARSELGRALLITHYGTDNSRAGWPSCVLELTSRVFPGLAGSDRVDRDRAVAGTFVETMVTATPRELARAFGWPVERAAAALQ